MNINIKTLLVRLIILSVIAKVLATIIYIVLPKTPLKKEAVFDITPQYIRVYFDNLFGKNKKEEKNEVSIYIAQVGDLVLKGLYGNEKQGYAIVANKHNPSKTTIIAKGEVYEGYTLLAVYIDHIVLEKNGKKYSLYLQKPKNAHLSTPLSPVVQDNNEDAIRVYHDDISYYASNPNAIWKNISIRELKKNGKIEGFKIIWIRQNTKFSQLGLKKGDVIIKVNNKRLRSYKDAVDIYKNISKIKTLSIVVLRNGEEKELVYAVE